MIRVFRITALAITLLFTQAVSGGNVDELIARLKDGEDFRVRVQAALDLGKTRDSRGLEPLENGLDDENAAVRAAAAAALKVLGNESAIPVLERHRRDPSASVRAQIKSSVLALRSRSEEREASEQPRVLVTLGSMRNAAGRKSGRLLGELVRASRARLDEMDGVRVVQEGDDYKSMAKKMHVPVVMLTGQLRGPNVKRQGTVMVYSARVEYIVHRMPGQTLLSTVSGSASTQATPVELRDERRVAELESAVLSAAVASAMRRAPEAFQAAMK